MPHRMNSPTTPHMTAGARRLRRDMTVPERLLWSGGGWGKGSACPSAEAQATELAERLRHALAELPPQQAQAFCLHCLEGESYEAASEQLGVSVNHVGVLIHRARARLRELLDPKGVAFTSPGRSRRNEHECKP